MSLIERKNWSEPAASSQPITTGSKPGRRHIFFAVFSVVLLALSFDVLRGVITYASDLENKNASQVFLIPFISAALIFLSRKKIFSEVRYAVVPGSLTILVGIALMVTAGRWGLQDQGDRLAASIFALLVAWLGGYVFFYGTASFKAALFPLLFLLFFMPIPSVILNPSIDFLRRGSAEIAYIMLKLSGTPIFREGFVFVMPGMNIEVAPECSGIRSCISMLILSMIAGHLLLQTQWKRVALVLVAIPVMIFKNALRIATLSLLAVHVDPVILESRLHREGGIPFFLVAMILIYPALRMLMKSERTVGQV